MKKAINAITKMIERSEKVQVKFEVGTSQHTLQKNRINALYIALNLIQNELYSSNIEKYTIEDYEKAVSPIKSLISKSEKAIIKLEPTSWQFKMLDDNIKALRIALPLLLNEKQS